MSGGYGWHLRFCKVANRGRGDWQINGHRGLADGGDCLFGVNAASNSRLAAGFAALISFANKPVAIDFGGLADELFLLL